MINFKRTPYVAGALVLCTLAACSSDSNPSTAGSTTIPNAMADGDTIPLEGNKPIIPELSGVYGSDDSTLYKNLITFKTEPASLKNGVDNLDINAYETEHGATATCSGNDQSFEAQFKIASSYILKTLVMHNVAACDSILQDFLSSCNKNPQIIAQDGRCTTEGNLYAYCADFRNYTTECSETRPDGTSKCHIVPDSTAILDTNIVIQEFVKKSENACTDITANKFVALDYYPVKDYWTPGHNPIDHLDLSHVGEPIDTASFTLEKYAAQFTGPEKEYTFDSHIIARRILPSSEAAVDSATGVTIKMPTPAEVAKYFPMTSSIAGENFNPEFCNIYTVTIPAFLSVAQIPTGFEEDYYNSVIMLDYIFASGDCKKDDSDFSEVFLVKDCNGIIDEYSTLGGDFIENVSWDSSWTCDENGVPPGRENWPDGEWYRADLRQ